MSGLVVDASVLATWFFADEEDVRIDQAIEAVALGEACAAPLATLDGALRHAAIAEGVARFGA